MRIKRTKPKELHPWRGTLVSREPVVVPKAEITVAAGLVDPEFDSYNLDQVRDWIENQQDSKDF